MEEDVGCQASDAACTGNNEICDGTQSPPRCSCPVGYFRLGPNCQAQNECGASSRNNCDKKPGASECTDLTPGFSCSCITANGWQDAPGSEPGTNCIDRDECMLGEDNCNNELTNKICVNRVPVNGKWECVEKTPAPTPSPSPRPSPSCIDEGVACSETSGDACCAPKRCSQGGFSTCGPSMGTRCIVSCTPPPGDDEPSRFLLRSKNFLKRGREKNTRGPRGLGRPF